jgi:hypothetical protein
LFSRVNIWIHFLFKLTLKGLSHEIDFKKFDKYLQNLAQLRDVAGFFNFLGAPMILKFKN